MSGFVKKAPPKPKTVRYIGMFAEVMIAEALEVGKVKRGDTVEVPGDLADRLCEQVANWELVEPPKPEKSKAVKKAAVVEEAAEEGPAEEQE